jgi:hypothetical protein
MKLQTMAGMLIVLKTVQMMVQQQVINIIALQFLISDYESDTKHALT